MDTKKIALKSLFIVMVLVSSFVSLVMAFLLFAFIFNPDDKEMLQLFLGFLVSSTLLWVISFYLATADKEKTKAEKVKEIKDLITKLPLILLSGFITSVYIFIYFMFFGFITTSKYGKGGWGGDNSTIVLLLVFILISIAIFGIVMYKVFKTDKQDVSLTLYNQFSVLKWSSLIALPFGFWSTYYFYHTEGFIGWMAMLIWDIVLYGFYKAFSSLSEKVHDQITGANVNRIIHEKKKNILNKEQTNTTITKNIGSVISVADELKKLKELYDQGVITQEELNSQKQKLL